MEDYIFIPGNVPSLKNGKQWTGKYLVKSKTVQNYLRSHGIQNYSSSDKTVKGYKTVPDTFRPHAVKLKKLLQNIDKPYKIEFYFIRKAKNRFDFGNAIELLSDLFTAYDVWEDDNCDNFLPFPWIIDNSVYKVDSKNPGVMLKVVKECPIY